MNSKKLESSVIEIFQNTIWEYFNIFGRSFEWRLTTNPYHIIVSEVMLQQTQTFRVAQKYNLFIGQFPDFHTLACAPLRDVIGAWSGLGYNRRALALQKTAQLICTDYNGVVPSDPSVLITFPGIGKATASSICAFAFNMPTVFIETNIRAVFIHFFFQQQEIVTDSQIIPLIEETLVQNNARNWYYALMDYGVMLKKIHNNPSKKSAHHTKQSRFEGSDRQIRGKVLKELTKNHQLSLVNLLDILQYNEQRIQKVLKELCNEGFICVNNNYFSIKS